MQKYTVIVGAGVTGLTAAHHLVRNGRKCLLVEKAAQVGGLCQSFILDKIVFDLGPHVFFIESDTEATSYMREILKQSRCISRPFSMAIETEGRYWRFPNHIDFFFYPWEYKKHIIASLLKRRSNPPDEDLSAKQELSLKCGEKFYQDLFSKMLCKKTLVPGDSLHFHWLARVDRDINNQKEPFQPLPRIKTLVSFLKRLRKPYIYPEEGCGMLPNKIWAEYTQLGGETLLKNKIEKVVTYDDYVKEVIINGQCYPVEDLIWTPSINAFNTLIKSDSAPLRYLDLVLIYVTYSKEKEVKRPFVYSYHLEKEFIFNRIYYPYSIFRNKSPKDREGLCLECSGTEELKRMTDKELIIKAVEQVETLGLYKKKSVRETKVIRLHEVMPVYDMDYEQQMEKAYSRVHNLSNVHSVGRQGGFLFCLSPGAVSQGIKISKALSAGDR